MKPNSKIKIWGLGAIGIICLVLLLGSFGLIPLTPPFQTETQTQDYFAAVADHSLVQVKLGKKILTVEIVNTPPSIVQGLSGRSEIGSDGLLFLFKEKRQVTFWMKGMQFDLDMVWISDGTIVDITSNVPKPKPGQGLRDLPTYSPQVPVNMVLELPAGKAAELQLRAGDRFSFDTD